MAKVVNKAVWAAVKEEYVTTDVGVRLLAEKYGISKSAVGLRCQKEEWPKLRDAYFKSVSEKARRRAEAEDVKALTDYLLVVKTNVDKLGTQIGRRLDSYDADDGGTAQDIRALTSALKDLASIIRNVYDLPTIQEREAMRIAGERLKIDKTRADADQTAEVTVTFTGDTEKWAR